MDCQSGCIDCNDDPVHAWDEAVAFYTGSLVGRTALQSGSCVAAVPVKRRIVELMSVPLVQGSLRYAYKVAEEQGGSKERAEGAVFSAAILPRIAACYTSAAEVISTNMAYTAAIPMAAGFTAVKEAF